MRQWNIFYSVDGGVAQQLIQEGVEFNAGHPLPGVYTGRNCVMLGDVASLPLTLPDGSILVARFHRNRVRQHTPASPVLHGECLMIIVETRPSDVFVPGQKRCRSQLSATPVFWALRPITPSRAQSILF